MKSLKWWHVVSVDLVVKCKLVDQSEDGSKLALPPWFQKRREGDRERASDRALVVK